MYVFINRHGEIEASYGEDEFTQAKNDIDDCRSILGDYSCYIAEAMLINGEFLVGKRVYPCE